jgi:hypothetical protein
LSKASDNQNLFKGFQPQVPDLVAGVKASMRDAARASDLSREQILDRMNGIALVAGVRLNVGSAKTLNPATFDKWLNPSDKEHVPGILAVNVFCAAVMDQTPLEVQLAAHGLELLKIEDVFARDYGRACLAEKKAKRIKRKLESQL